MMISFKSVGYGSQPRKLWINPSQIASVESLPGPELIEGQPVPPAQSRIFLAGHFSHDVIGTADEIAQAVSGGMA